MPTNKLTIADIASCQRSLTPADLTELLQLDKSTITRMCKAGRIPHFRIGACVRFNPQRIAAWLQERGA